MLKEMRIATIVLSVLATLPPLAAQIPIPTQELLFPHMVAGGGWETEVTIIAQGPDDSGGQMAFFGRSGLPLAVRVDGEAPSTTTVYSLLNRSAQTFTLTRSGQATVGFIILSQAVPGNQDTGSINGIETFRFKEGASVSAQVGVAPSPALTKAHLPFNNTGGNRTAFAMASLVDNSIDFTVYTEAGSHLETKTLNFSALNQQSLFVDELSGLSQGRRGFIKMRSDSPFHFVALDQNNLRLSTAGSLPGVIERRLTIVAGDTTTWNLRLVENGQHLTGIAERTGANPTTTIASGAIAIHPLQPSNRSLALTIHAFSALGTGLNIVLVAPVIDPQLISLSGDAVILTANGSLTGTGTFNFFALSSAPF